MNTIAFAVYLVALLVTFGIRTALHHRRTGRTGFHGITGRPNHLAWWGGILLIAAIVLGIAGTAAAAFADLPPEPPRWMQATGLVIALIGFVCTILAQSGMGASWRIGVDPHEQTDLVTTGIFGIVRNPIFTSMVIAQTGITVAVPNGLSVGAMACLVVAVHIQVRVVEEPHLHAHHGAVYDRYVAATGRFLPKFRTHQRRRPSEPAD